MKINLSIGNLNIEFPPMVHGLLSVSTAAKIMRERDISMITDRDLAIRILADKLSPDTIVEDIMTAELLSCSPEDTVEEAADLMAERHRGKTA